MTGAVVVVGLGPAGADLVAPRTIEAIDRVAVRFVRTARHPAANVVAGAESFDPVYDAAAHLHEVYEAIVERLVEEASVHGEVLYAVPGSPSVAERSVALLVADARVEVELLPAMSFIDLAWARLGVDPLTCSPRIVDGHEVESAMAADRGPFLVAQCDRPEVLERVKLLLGEVADAVGVEHEPVVVVLGSLGSSRESIREVPWHELDRIEPDHLTSLWIPQLAAPVAPELQRFAELVATLRQGCPWDREQTHGSLRRHLLEETYEVLEALDAVAATEAADDADDAEDPAVELAQESVYDLLEEELGDLLFQVVFHATIAAEAGRFTLGDVARGIHDKLWARHPHVFGDAADGREPDRDQLSIEWEHAKRDEKGRRSVFDGMPAALPALAYAAKVRKKAAALGVVVPATSPGATGAHGDDAEEVVIGEMLMAVVERANRAGVDAETALRTAADRYRDEVRSSELGEPSDGAS